MKYLFILSAAVLVGCSAKPVGSPRCWVVVSSTSHSIARSDWYYLKLKDSSSGQKSYLDTSIFRPYTPGDNVCVQKYDDGGIKTVKYIPAP